MRPFDLCHSVCLETLSLESINTPLPRHALTTSNPLPCPSIPPSPFRFFSFSPTPRSRSLLASLPPRSDNRPHKAHAMLRAEPVRTCDQTSESHVLARELPSRLDDVTNTHNTAGFFAECDVRYCLCSTQVSFRTHLSKCGVVDGAHQPERVTVNIQRCR